MKIFNLHHLLVFLILILLAFTACKWETRGGKNYGIYAPEDAWFEGDTLPYYGSENEWSRRMFEKGPADRFYKRRGQRQLLAILDGNPRKAVRYCRQRLKEDPNDPEIYYMLTLAYCSMHKPDKAEEYMEHALELGLPFGRFIAGPRELMKPISHRELFRKYLSETSPLVHGPMLGILTRTSVSCWVRTAEESSVQMVAWETPNQNGDNILEGTSNLNEHSGSPQSGHPIQFSSIELMSRADNDYTAVVELKGLEPGTTYIYNILIDGMPSFSENEMPSFITKSFDCGPGRYRIAFGGCAGYTPKAEKIWTTILEHEPEALLLLGDNVYVDLPEMPGAFHDYTYYRRYSRPEFRSLISRVPVYSIWDDHDAAIDDIWMGPYIDKPDWKLPMIRHFQRNWVNPGYGTEEWPGCWYSFKLGDIEFFMLDGRTYRTNPFGPDPTMLGPVQKHWLLSMIENSTARIKVLASPVAWNDLAKPGSHDTWSGFRKERNEIFKFIIDNDINGIVLMSADRHRSEAWEFEWDGSYKVYEFLSSRLTNMHFHDIEPGAIFSYNDPQSFGLLNFETTKDPPEVQYEIINLHGVKVFAETFLIGK